MVLGSGRIDHPESLCFLRKNQFNFTINMFIELSKSEANWDIAVFVKQKVITVDELDGFREDLIDAVKLICKRQIPRELYISEGKPTLHGKTAHESVLSIGCGAGPDIMALERFLNNPASVSMLSGDRKPQICF